MKIKETRGQYEDYRSYIRISIDNKLAFSAHDGEPEDNTLSRNFADCFCVVDLMKLAYEAGLKGEPFEVVEVNMKEGEDIDEADEIYL